MCPHRSTAQSGEPPTGLPTRNCPHSAGPGLCPWRLRPHLGSGRDAGREEAGRVPTAVRAKEEKQPQPPRERGLGKLPLG